MGGSSPFDGPRVVERRGQGGVGLAVRGQRPQRRPHFVLNGRIVGEGQVVQQDRHGIGRGAAGQQAPPRRPASAGADRLLSASARRCGRSPRRRLGRRPEQRQGAGADLLQRLKGALAVVEVVGAETVNEFADL